MVPEDPKSLEAVNKARFVVAHVPYMVSPLVNMADVLLPMPAWYEKGHFCTLEGERRRMNMIVPPKKGFVAFEDFPGSCVTDGRFSGNFFFSIARKRI